MNTESITAVAPKNLEERLQENPNHLKELIQHSESNLAQNTLYFFKQSDVPAFLEFILSHDIQIEMRGKGLDNTVRALQRLQMCNHQHKEDFELLSTQQKWYDNKVNNRDKTEIELQNTQA
jgi:hypothetical protein